MHNVTCDWSAWSLRLGENVRKPLERNRAACAAMLVGGGRSLTDNGANFGLEGLVCWVHEHMGCSVEGGGFRELEEGPCGNRPSGGQERHGLEGGKGGGSEQKKVPVDVLQQHKVDCKAKRCHMQCCERQHVLSPRCAQLMQQHGPLSFPFDIHGW